LYLYIVMLNASFGTLGTVLDSVVRQNVKMTGVEAPLFIAMLLRDLSNKIVPTYTQIKHYFFARNEEN
jgi:hypothetical protein